MSKPRKELPYEARVLIAFLASVLVMAVWSYYFRPEPPRPQPPEQSGPAQPTSEPDKQPVDPTPQPGKAQPGATPPSVAATKEQPPSAARAATAVQGEGERTLVVENGVYRVLLSNRGGVVESWQLLGYTDSQKNGKTLDVVDSETARGIGAWPLSIAVADKELNNKINSAIFEVTPATGPIEAPAEVVFRWSDGVASVTKRLRFDDSYVVAISTSVVQNGKPVPHSITWRGGFGDRAAYQHADQTFVIYRTAGALHSLSYKNLGQPEDREQWFQQPETMDYAGIADRYFAAVFVSDGAGAPAASTAAGLTLWHSVRQHETTVNGKKQTAPVPEIAVGPTSQAAFDVRLYVGPKDVDVLARQQPPMTELVDFGWDWIEPISRLLFVFLKWIHTYVPSWGWAIVIMTFAIIMALYPLKVKSWRSMQRMQKLMPEMQQIKQRYAKYKFNDPRKQQEQQEMMALYKKHGMSPLGGVGGCLPMLLQMPIWFALYQMLGAAIELRHARWLWIRDLASPDPFYVLPIFMAVSMYASQKMTPVTTPDPAQARMMNMMPLIFGGMFVIFPVSSGLVLYIFTSMLVGMAQQWYLNRTSPIKKKPREEKK